jgi:putative phosphoesterase
MGWRMRIGLITDTHVSSAEEELPREIALLFKEVDLILHAGDIYILEVLDWLETIAPVLAAHGNGDWQLDERHSSRRDPRLRESHVISAEGVTIGLVHYFPLPGDPRWANIQGLMELNFGSLVNVIVCGDTHEAMVTTQDGILLVNSGGAWGHGTLGILEVNQGKAEAQLLRF